MEKQKEQNKNKAEGLKKLKEFKSGALRGYKEIGKKIIQDYNITEADLKRMKQDSLNRYARLQRARARKKREAAAAANINIDGKEEQIQNENE